jgi:caffeic acid 3-O-methyltransferase
MKGMDIQVVSKGGPLHARDMDIQAVEDERVLQASALSMAFSIVSPFLLKCALRLKIPDIIWRAGPDVPLSVHQIAAQLPSEAPDVDALSRILTYLSTMGILQAIKPTEGTNTPMDMKYALTNLSKTYFVSEDINSLSLVPFVLFQTRPVLVAAWDHIHERVLHGGDNFQNSSGKDFWNYTASDPEFNGIFNAAMVSITKVNMKEILATYDGFKDVNTLIDFGGGHGEALNLITDAYPHIHAINFDLPHVIATAPTLPGIQHISGNLFESIPSTDADAIFIKNVLHFWDDEGCIKLLNNCYQAVADKGKLIIAEAVLDLTEDSDLIGSAQVLDALMLNVSPGGRERTRKQWIELLKAGGFSLSKIVGRKGTIIRIIEAIKC